MSLLEAVSLDEVQLGLCMQHEHPVCLVVLRHAVGGTFNAAPSKRDINTMLAMSAVVVSVSATLFACISKHPVPPSSLLCWQGMSWRMR